MKTKTDQIFKVLSNPTGNDIADVFSDLADIIAMNCMTGFLPDDPNLQSEKLSEQELDQVKKTLIKYIEGNEMEEGIASAFWCLSKFFDEDLKPFFIEHLHSYYKRARADLSAMGQIEICLSNLGEDILSDDSYSVIEYEKNMNDTWNYLKLIGKIK